MGGHFGLFKDLLRGPGKVVFAKRPRGGLCKAESREDKKSAPKTSQEKSRGLIRIGQDLLRERYVAPSGPLRTSSRAHQGHSGRLQRRSRGFFGSCHVVSSWPLRTSLEHLRGLIKAVQDLSRSHHVDIQDLPRSSHVASSGASKTSSEAATWLHHGRSRHPQGRLRGFH